MPMLTRPSIHLVCVILLIQQLEVVWPYRQLEVNLKHTILKRTATPQRSSQHLPTKAVRKETEGNNGYTNSSDVNTDDIDIKSQPEIGYTSDTHGNNRNLEREQIVALEVASDDYFSSDSETINETGELEPQPDLEEEPLNAYRKIHMDLMEGKEYQLHIPPIANFKPPMRKALTNTNVYQHYLPGNTEKNEHGEYIDGPLNINELAQKGEIPEFRHEHGGTITEPGEADLFTWKVERPPDVFVINWSGVVHNGYRDGVVTAARAILDFTDNQPREVREFLNMVAEEHKLPTWLATRAKYAQPFIECETDWIPALQYFMNNCNEQNLLSEPEQLQALATTQAKPIDIVTHMTEGGDTSKIVDLGKRQRQEMGIETFELKEWKLDGNRYSDNVSTYNKMLKQLGLESGDFEQHFRNAQERIYEDRMSWKNLVLYRTKCDMLEDEQRIHHEAYNCGVVSAIKHHLEVFQVPVYILSDTETSLSILRKLEALDIKLMNDVHVYGRERGSPVQSLRNLLAGLHLDDRIPVHYFDDRLANLEACNSTQELQHVRTYFVDWGRSTWSEKLGALYADQVKYVKTTAWLAKFMATPVTEPGREWTHGFRLRLPDEEAVQAIRAWKQKWHRLPQLTHEQRRPTLKVS
ncbi:hypothetical protein BaOVIS_032010 [Babesia ovis]|uniref:Uncharacterized protein n=1 Tax=Babesia ovis TaxID=5869 RepID=A0A9W5WWM0_BABOV|nr:hypothetical protein BaOVIS_032010 [Babesia ovis]